MKKKQRKPRIRREYTAETEFFDKISDLSEQFAKGMYLEAKGYFEENQEMFKKEQDPAVGGKIAFYIYSEIINHLSKGTLNGESIPEEGSESPAEEIGSDDIHGQDNDRDPRHDGGAERPGNMGREQISDTPEAGQNPVETIDNGPADTIREEIQREPDAVAVADRDRPSNEPPRVAVPTIQSTGSVGYPDKEESLGDF